MWYEMQTSLDVLLEFSSKRATLEICKIICILKYNISTLTSLIIISPETTF